MKTITIQVPDDCDIQIVRKEENKEPIIKTFQDLYDEGIMVCGYYINMNSRIVERERSATEESMNIAASEKVAKSMLAMAMISQLMPYYGGAITDEEWKNEVMEKYTIKRYNDHIDNDYVLNSWNFLAFRTKEQRDNFLKYNKQLVKDYLMID